MYIAPAGYVFVVLLSVGLLLRVDGWIWLFTVDRWTDGNLIFDLFWLWVVCR